MHSNVDNLEIRLIPYIICLSAANCPVLNKLLFPEKPVKDAYRELIQRPKNHFNPAINKTVETIRLTQARS